MRELYGVLGIRLWVTQFIDEANQFLQEHDGHIIDIIVTDEDIVIVYREEVTEV